MNQIFCGTGDNVSEIERNSPSTRLRKPQSCIFLLLTFFLVLTTPSWAQSALTSLDGGKVLALAAELSGPQFDGRQIGTPGGIKAGDLLAQYLSDAGFQVTFQEFQALIPCFNGPMHLEVQHADGSNTTFRHRIDFKENIRGEYGNGVAEGSLYSVNSPQDKYPKGAILLIPNGKYNQNDDSQYKAWGASGLIVETSSISIAQKAVYANQGLGIQAKPHSGLPKLWVTNEVFSSLIEDAKKNAKLRMVNSIEYRQVTGRNIIALFNGDGGKFTPLFALTAHYDHVGSDPDGSYFQGALDNASGTALAVAVARAIAGEGFNGDFAVILSDGEEEGLLGSFTFAKSSSFSIKGLPMLNIDMVASKADLPITIEYGQDRYKEQAKNAVKMFESAGFRTEVNKGDGSDFVAYESKGGLSISISEVDPIYHTLRDTIDILSAEEFGRLGDAVRLWAMNLVVKKK